MGTVFTSVRRYRVTVNSNDHWPRHVHAMNRGLNARFKLRCPKGTAVFWDIVWGEWDPKHLNELGQEITDEMKACCEEWSRIHGKVPPYQRSGPQKGSGTGG
jgi:hypothetical protein